MIVMFKRGPLAWMPIDERTARAYQWTTTRGRVAIVLVVYASVLAGVWFDGIFMATLARALGWGVPS